MNERQYICRILAIIVAVCCICASLVGCVNTTKSETGASETTGPVCTTENTNSAPTETTYRDNTTYPTETETKEPSQQATEATHIHSFSCEVVAPTCTEKGYSVHTCNCGDKFKDSYVDALGHSYQKKVIAPTCSGKGYTENICSVCSVSYTSNEVSATGHSWSTWKVIKQASVSEEGTEQRNCTICNTSEKRKIEKLPEPTKPTYESFTGEIGKYKAHNLSYTDWKGDTEQAAYIEVYSLEKDDKVLTELSAEFKRVYGFTPNLNDTYRVSSSCKKLGVYLLDGYEEPQTVYLYTITDKSYIYITNDMYKVYTQIADDGSYWVGYCIYATMDTLTAERNKAEVKALDQEMYATFERLIGVSRSEMNDYKEELDLRIGYISEAGIVRSCHVDGLVNVLYIYCRGFALPVNEG